MKRAAVSRRVSRMREIWYHGKDTKKYEVELQSVYRGVAFARYI